MSRRIFKYTLSMRSVTDIQMRLNSEILDVQLQDKIVCVWALSKDTSEREQRKIKVFGTGMEIPDHISQSLNYIGTVQHGMNVMHVFEEIQHIDLDETLSDVSYIIAQNDGDLYWSNEIGWVGINIATHFTDAERYTVSLPIGGNWVRTNPI